MKKLSAILLFSLLAFSQYARQLNYLSCKFSNTFKSSSEKCDCEKQAGFDAAQTSQLPVPATHTHIHPDEFYSVVKGIIITSYPPALRITPGHFRNDDECTGIYPGPWEPPNYS